MFDADQSGVYEMLFPAFNFILSMISDHHIHLTFSVKVPKSRTIQFDVGYNSIEHICGSQSDLPSALNESVLTCVRLLLESRFTPPC
jgi:hypothetical protein